MARGVVKIVRDDVERFKKQLAALTRDMVLVGIPMETAERDPDVDEEVAPLTNAEIGYLMEFGSPEANIPARPFLVPGVENAMDEIERRYRTGAQAVLEAKATADKVHNVVGLVAAASVKRKIADGPFAPLSEVTLQRRRARGRKGTKPLQDTGAMRNSVTYAIRPGNEVEVDG